MPYSFYVCSADALPYFRFDLSFRLHPDIDHLHPAIDVFLEERAMRNVIALSLLHGIPSQKLAFFQVS